MAELDVVDAPEAEAAADEPVRSAFLNLVAQPITPSEPAGADVTYDDAFQQMKGEIDKLATAAAGDVDFKQVIEQGRELLTKRTKDLRVAVFLTLAAYRAQGFAGMAEALAATRLVTEEFWEHVYPPKKRMNARRNALQMLNDRLKEWVADEKPAAADREAVEQALEEARALQAFCMNTMAEKAPALSGLTKALDTVARRVPKPAPAPASEPASGEPRRITPATATLAPSAGAAAGAEVSDVRSEMQARQQALLMAAFIREQDARSPLAYALTRTVRWTVLSDDLPNENGKTLVEPPPKMRREFIAGLLPKNDFERLVREAEESFAEPPFHFWLDLQRMMASALDALGEPYRDVYEAVLHATAVLVHRLPGLARLSFSDGTPFADPLTLEWIEADVRPVLGGGGGGGGTSLRLGRAHLEEQYEAVRKQAGRGDLHKAVAAMQEGREQDETAQDRFVRQLYVAELCVRGGRPEVAVPMLEALEATVVQHALDAWEPALALRVWTALYKSHEALSRADDLEDTERGVHSRSMHDAFAQMCRLDPQSALASASG